MTVQSEMKQVDCESVLDIRQKVMYPEKSRDFVRVENDENGMHFGCFVGSEMIGVISLLVKDEKAQFRKFAVLEMHQGNGYGSHMLEHVLKLSRKYDVRKVWCNARKNAQGLYRKYGFLEVENSQKIKNGIEYAEMYLNLN